AYTVTVVLDLMLLTNAIGRAQQAPGTPMSVGQAVESALRNYPAVTVSQEQVNSAAAAIDLARTAYLPRVDSLAQFNRATRNNVFGLLFPQGVIPTVSGPALGTNNFGTVWGSAVGTLTTWEPFDFGLRRASVSAATAAKTRSEATLKRTELDVAAATAEAYLMVAAAQETMRAAQAGVDRAEVLVRSVRALVDAQLRPGADALRAVLYARRGVCAGNGRKHRRYSIGRGEWSCSRCAELRFRVERNVSDFRSAFNPGETSRPIRRYSFRNSAVSANHNRFDGKME